MTLKILPALTILSTIIISCDPTHSLVVSNNSNQEKTIEVAFTNYDTYKLFGLQDSIGIFKDKIKGEQNLIPYKIAVTKDTSNKSFLFKLPSGENALLEFGFGSRPIPNRKIIVDQVDTISIRRGSKKIIRKPRIAFGGEYRLTINK